MQDIKVLKLAVAIYMTSPEGTEVHWDDLTGQRQRYFIGRAKSILHALEYDGFGLVADAPLSDLATSLTATVSPDYKDEWERGYDVGQNDAGKALNKLITE